MIIIIITYLLLSAFDEGYGALLLFGFNEQGSWCDDFQAIESFRKKYNWYIAHRYR